MVGTAEGGDGGCEERGAGRVCGGGMRTLWGADWRLWDESFV